MSTKNQYVDPNDEMLKNVTQTSSDIQDDYTAGMKDAIALNEGAKAEALGSIGVDEHGDVIEGSATDKLMDAQEEQTQFTIDEIERKKAEAEKDYKKEQTAAYVDWQKQSGKFGVHAEKMAAQGLENSGYSESSQVSMYNQYQARVTAAREAFVRAQSDYDAAIANARVQNSVALAQIAADAMRQRTELIVQFSLNGINLLTNMTQGQASLRQQGLSNYMTVYNQIANLEESRRQHDDEMKLAYDKLEQEKQLAEDAYKYIENQTGESGGESGEGKEAVVADYQNTKFDKMIDALSFLTKHNIFTDMPLLNSTEWKKGKSAGRKGEEFMYNSYPEYLRAYIKNAIDYYSM